MRLFLVVPVLCLLFSSCKKTYTCECYTSVTFYDPKSGRFYTEVIPSNKLTYNEKLTEKQATAACRHEEVTTQTSFVNWFTYNGNVPMVAGESVNSSCGLR